MRLSWQEAIHVIADRGCYTEYMDSVAEHLVDLAKPSEARAFLDEVKARVERMRLDIIAWEDEKDE